MPLRMTEPTAEAQRGRAEESGSCRLSLMGLLRRGALSCRRIIVVTFRIGRTAAAQRVRHLAWLHIVHSAFLALARPSAGQAGSLG